MLTIERVYDNLSGIDSLPLRLYGLSTDTKPVESTDRMPLVNGSTFYEIDTKFLYMWDQENSTWVKQ